MEETSMHGDGAIITVKVKFGEKKFPILISPNSTVSNLKYLLLTLTNVLPQRQKLISKGSIYIYIPPRLKPSFLSTIFLFIDNGFLFSSSGKVLEDSQTLTASNVTNGSNIMLVATEDLHHEVDL